VIISSRYSMEELRFLGESFGERCSNECSLDWTNVPVLII
jgi:hypothetical protein